MRSCLAGGGVVALAALASGCDVQVGERGISVDLVEGRASDEWARTYTLPPAGRLEIVNVNGAILVFPATGPEVEVRVRREVRTRSDQAAQTLLAGIEMREEVSPERVKIEARHEDDAPVGGLGRRVTLEYRLNIPPGLDVSLTTENGNLRLENVDGRFTAATTNGGVTGRGISGAIDAATVNGGIQMDLAAVTGSTRLVTINGGVRVTVPPDADATLEATAVNGGIVVAERLPLIASERSRLRVSGRINEGGPVITLQTTNGGIRVGVSDGQRR